MRVLGLLGGMSWESTDYYYQRLNRGVRERLGGLHSAHSVTYTVDFAEIERMQVAGAWDEAGKFLGECARKLERAGAEGLILCTNTMHRVIGAIEDAVDIPVLHIADGTARALLDDGVKEVALLGTRYTMEQDFYRKRLEANGLTVVVPDQEDRDTVHRVIFDELCQGRVEEGSRQAYLRILEKLPAEAVIFGCTEIGLLLDQEQSPLRVYDTTLLHVEAALDWMLSEG
ncbi:aspartate/glutamate racemase family protein [Actinoplanes sp. NPDC048796]|uniref:aspartate/glutamate racemase family protein n=1 Tax=unclassified Actinoplanes TaxID=2626549 RepID=UPI0033E6A344